MKKLLVIVSIAALGMVSTSVFGGETYEERYETSRHNIRVICSLDDGNCTYESWNKPKKIGQGTPDFEIGHGEYHDTLDALQKGSACEAGHFDFRKGSVFILMQTGLARYDRGCFPKPLPAEVDGILTVYINNQEKAHYWLSAK